MNKNKFRISIRGGYGLSNFGDDALMVNIYNKVNKHYKGKDVVLLCNKNEYILKLLPNAQIIDSLEIPQNFNTDLLVYGGGTQFFSFPTKTIFNRIEAIFKRPLKETFRLVLVKLKLLTPKKSIEGKFEIANKTQKIAIVGVGLGPFYSEDTIIEEKTKILFNKAQFISIRDVFAEEKCKEWNVKEFYKYPDICYSDESPSVLNSKNTTNKVSEIGIIIRDWNHEKEGAAFENSLFKSAETLREKGYKVTFISFAKDADKYWNSILKRKNEKVLLWNPNNTSVERYLQQLKSFDLFITARYHGAVYASLLNKPFISVEVEQKLKMIANLYQGGALCWQKPFISSKLIEKVAYIDDNYQEFKDNIAQKATELKELSKDHFNKFDSFLNN